jgi:hypothetical protein
MVSPLPGATGVAGNRVFASIVEGATAVDLNSVRLRPHRRRLERTGRGAAGIHKPHIVDRPACGDITLQTVRATSVRLP